MTVASLDPDAAGLMKIPLLQCSGGSDGDCVSEGRPVSVELYLPPTDATLNRGGFLAERCLADVTGFLASCFSDEAVHRHHWKQRALPDGRLLISTPAGYDSYYKRTLIKRGCFRWGAVTLSATKWVDKGEMEFVPNFEPSVGLELSGLPFRFWNSEALAILVSPFGAFDAIDVRSLRWSETASYKVRMRVQFLRFRKGAVSRLTWVFPGIVGFIPIHQMEHLTLWLADRM
ncbi:hypothetical protein Cni_G07685 [Canna indica]|uniref:DUF4283 domain-containing protein n=1 Tax=Canna indica TaxID=4628 RepID=A0AAQ3JZ60_9LILI|nr:hypothetical protein Cni_G07685 [Canna indica]